MRETIAPLPRGWRATLIVIWIACAAAATFIGRGEHDAYLLSTVPTAGSGINAHANSLAGYSVFLNGAPRMGENIETWNHVAMFNGAGIAADMYAMRPLYPFLVSCFAWALGVSGACKLVNLIAWALGTWAAVRVGAETARAWQAGVVAGLLACAGAGWWLHIDDYSAHLLSFATSAVALLALLRSRVWSRRQPAEIHAAIAAVLVIANLAYNSGLFFVAAYVLLALPRNTWWHVLLAAAASVAVQRTWTPLLNFLSDRSFDYYAVERQLFEGAMRSWPEWLSEGSWLLHSWDVFIDTLVPYAAVVPLIVVGVLAPIFGGRAKDADGAPPNIDRGAAVLLLLAIAIPIAATIFYSPTAHARGYLVFGASTAVWGAAGVLFARLRPGAWRAVGVVCLLIALALSGFLDTAHARGDARAAKLFMWGHGTWNRATLDSLRASSPTEVLGLAGEAAPMIGGGARPMSEVGGFTGGKLVATLPAFKNGAQMLVVRGVLVLAIAVALRLVDGAGLFRVRWWRRKPVVAISIAVLLLVPSIAARARNGGPEIARHDLYNRALPQCARTVTYEVDVDPSRIERLEYWRAAGTNGAAGADSATEPMDADVLTGFGWNEGEGVDVEILAGPKSIARFSTEGIGRRRIPIDLDALVAALREHPQLRVVATRADGITSVASWQRGDLQGRRIRLDAGEPLVSDAAPAPILEIRVVPRERQYDPRLLLF